jgi:hypothetical protein
MLQGQQVLMFLAVIGVAVGGLGGVDESHYCWIAFYS